MLARFRRLARRIASLVVRTMVQGLFFTVERTLPIRDDFWCFCTWTRYPHTLDNPRAVFEEVKDDPSIRKIILQKDRTRRPISEGRNVRFVPAESFAGAYYLARSRIVLTGYALRQVTSYSRWLRRARHDVVQLWHGVPLKRIGRFFPGRILWDWETSRYAATVCSAERDQEVMVRAFFPIPRERVWLSGLPRNDLILKDEGILPADYREHLAQLEELLRGRRLALYAPTWREADESLYVFSGEEERELELLLQNHGAVLGIRGHANVRQHHAYTQERNSNRIVLLNDFPDVNILLRRTCVLITDYSSIYIDYLLLDRPIVHFAYDLESYVSERGFLYDLNEAFGGACARTFPELMSLMGEALEDAGHYKHQRDEAFRIFHAHGNEAAGDVCSRIRELSHRDNN